MPRILTIRSKGHADADVVSLVLSQDAIVESQEGDPLCGVSLTAEQARSLAERLFSIATEIENREEPGYRTSSKSFTHLSSIAVVHDGSAQGHRAFQAGLRFASNHLGTIDLVGIFGINSQTGEPSADDQEWQKGWLYRLVVKYSEQAISEGITFNWRLFPANDPCSILDNLYHTNSDLIIIPRRVTRFGAHGERLMSSIVGRTDTNILVCA
jgi:hypothetical protein